MVTQPPTGDRDGGAILLAALRRRWPLLLLGPALATALALAHLSMREPQHAAVARFLVDERRVLSVPAADLPVRADIARVQSDEFEQLVARRLGVDSAPAVAHAAVESDGWVAVVATASSARLALDAADAYVAVFLESRRERILAELAPAAALLRGTVDDQLERLAAVDPDDASTSALHDDLTMLIGHRNAVLADITRVSRQGVPIEAAQLTSMPDQIAPTSLLLTAAAGGLLLGAAAAFVLAGLGASLRPVTAD